MKSLVYDELVELCDKFHVALRNHLLRFKDDGKTKGYAIVIGEDIDQLEASAVTNSSTDKDPDGALDSDPEYMYIPDEWENWHNDAFSDFNADFRRTYELFRERHPEKKASKGYSKAEQAYIINVCNMYLGAAIACAEEGAFGNIGYRLIWISDCDYPVIAESIRQLNDPKVSQQVLEMFGG